MSSEDPNPIESISKGATKGLLEWTEDKILNLVNKIVNHELAFIGDSENIKRAKEQRQLSEYNLFCQYVENKDLRILFQMGLTLRGLEKNNLPIDQLQTKISNKYHGKGKHIAYFVQNGIFGKYLANLLQQPLTLEEVKYEVNEFFSNIDKYTSFIKNFDKVKQKANEIVAKINANGPRIFVISAALDVAMSKCKSIKLLIIKNLSGYTCESYVSSLDREIYFINKMYD